MAAQDHTATAVVTAGDESPDFHDLPIWHAVLTDLAPKIPAAAEEFARSLSGGEQA